MSAISLHSVSKQFKSYNCQQHWLRRDLIDLLRGKRGKGDTWTVLHDINLEIGKGETVAIFGRNGCGKSTLLKLMAGILRPTAGRVVTRGTIGTLLEIGTGFHEDLTGRENVLVNGAVLGLAEKYVRLILPEIEHFAELEGFMDTPIRYYSSGMTARLGFAVAMSADPDIFLIDEVLAVGDEGFKRKCYKRLDELVSRGRTIIIVSHDTSPVRRICTRGIWLEDGTVRMDGPIEEVCDQYIEAFGPRETALDMIGDEA